MRRPRGPAVLAAGLALFLAFAGDVRAAARAWPEGSRLAIVHPGVGRAVPLARQGTVLLQAGDHAPAIALLEQAVAENPLFDSAWINLAAARAGACDRDGAVAAALVAVALAPADARAEENLAIARALSCAPSAYAPDPRRTAERALASRPDDPAAWLAAADERRGAHDRALALVYDECAVQRGAAEAFVAARAADDLEALGLLRAAAAALPPSASERAAALHARAATFDAAAREIGASVARRARLGAGEEADGAIALAHALLARGAAAAAVASDLDSMLGVARAGGRVDGPWGELTLPGDWSLVRRTDPSGGPLVLCRRFPGETQFALAGWDGTPVAGAAAAIPRVLAGASAQGGATPCAVSVEGTACATLALVLDGGAAGRVPATGYLLGPKGGPPVLLGVGIAGDAGCGPTCRRDAQAALDALAAAVRPKPVASGGPVRVPVPPGWRPPGTRPRESAAPWRSAPLGSGLVIDLPPGIVAAAPSAGIDDPALGPDTALALRGDFTDLDGRTVRLGGPTFRGWVDVRHDAKGRLVAAARAAPASLLPRSDPGAVFLRSTDLGPALKAARTGDEGIAASFRGAGFGGTWIVFRVRAGTAVADIVLPVAEGAGSTSLGWIATTLRTEEGPAPPPAVDLTSNWNVRFVRTADRSPNDPREGTLDAGEFQVAVPRGFRVSLSPGSADGFPVTLRGPDGATIAVERLAPGPAAGPSERQTDAAGHVGVPLVFREVRSLRGAVLLESTAGAGAVPVPTDRYVLLVVPEAPAERAAYRLVATRAGIDEERWGVVRDVLRSSARWKKSTRD